MLNETPQLSPEEIRVEMKRRFDEINEAAEVRHKLRRELGDIREAKAHNHPPQPVSHGDDADALDDSGGMGENDSLGG